MQQLHGSGKTAVLVERIINKVINEKIDIDKLLVVTFTNAAAAEMRERILEELYKKIEEDPSDKRLQKQVVLLNKASISTVHSFCLEVIRNYFYEIDVSSNFRVADTKEAELLKEEALEELFDQKYEEEVEDFIKLVNIYCGYRDDEDLRKIVLDVFGFIQSTPFPEEWMAEQIEKFNLKENKEDFGNTSWGEILVENFKEEIEAGINSLKSISEKLKEKLELEKYYLVLKNDIGMLEGILNKKSNWDEMYGLAYAMEFIRWPADTKIDLELKDEAKAIRDKVSKRIRDRRDRIFISTSNEIKEDIYESYELLSSIAKLVIEFSDKYREMKKEKNIIDFNDIEHYALEILVKKDEKGKNIASDVANMYQEKFSEIAIDEYQDSNLVQEYILSVISRGNNIFMVGDVKQSIYKFRQARPELFWDKYATYRLKKGNDKDCKEDTLIQLFKNFRSRTEVLDIINLIFTKIMSRTLGDIEYTKEEYLNLGADYPEEKKDVNGDLSLKPELHIIDLANVDEDGLDELSEPVEKTEIEAKFVANRIKELFDNDFQVYDSAEKNYRKVQARDIAILLRKTTDTAPIYEKELSDIGYGVFTDSGSSYFSEIEIETILCLLKIIDNPNQDIPLVSILRSSISGFTDNELVEIRMINKNISFYEALTESLNSIADGEIKSKVVKFLELLEDLQRKQEYLKLHELIWHIYELTGYYNYVSLMPNGNYRTANLKKLFEEARNYEKVSFKGLYNFINYIDKISSKGNDTGAAKLIRRK